MFFHFAFPFAYYSFILSHALYSFKLHLTNGRLLPIIGSKDACDKAVRFTRNGLPATIKTDKNNHGFGTEKISQLAKQYGGRVSFNCEHNVFTTDLLLKYK